MPKKNDTDEQIYNCLRNEKVRINLLPKKSPLFNNPNHILSGNLAPTACIRYQTPLTSSGTPVAVLTADEQACIENIMGVDPGYLSPFKKENNFWELYTTEVRLQKTGNVLDLSDPMDYIKYKILLANKEAICPSLDDYAKEPKESYRFVIVRDNEEIDKQEEEVTDLEKCFEEFGKVGKDAVTLRVIIEAMEHRETAPTTKLASLRNKVTTLIQKQPRLMRAVMTDKLLPFKVLIKNGVECGVLARMGNGYYVREGQVPMCGANEDPSLATACRWIALPKNQDVKFKIEDETKKMKTEQQ